jgi:MraZ protein
MFAGTFQHTLDAKHRVVVPSKFRLFLEEPEDKKGFFVTRWKFEDASCLFMYPVSTWRQVLGKLSEVADRSEQGEWFLRKFATEAEFAKVDKQWRMVLPERLIEDAGLQKDIVLAGVFDRIEVWDQKIWEEKDAWMSKEYSRMRADSYGLADLTVQLRGEKKLP